MHSRDGLLHGVRPVSLLLNTTGILSELAENEELRVDIDLT
ncbi:hypothetical protein [Halalkalibacter okhensis]|nr:hypothetical protein [Halalkalibacter okhensis]